MPRMGRKRKVDLGLEPRVYPKHGAFYYVHPQGRWERLSADKDEANSKARAYNDPHRRAGTLVHFFDLFLRAGEARVKAGDLAQRTLDDYQEAIGTDDEPGPLRIYFAPPRTPLEVKPKHVQDYLDAGKAAGRARRANLERACLSACFGWMLRTEQCPGLEVNPCLRASGVKRNAERPRDRYVTDEEYQAVWDEATASVRLMMELSYRTLQRPESDIVLWDSRIIVQRDGAKMLHFQQHKTGQWMLIAVTPELEQLLPHDDGNVRRLREPLVQRLDGEHYTYTGLSSMLKKARAAANKRRKARKLEPIPSFGFRDLKGKGATDMWRAGVDLRLIQALCGHKHQATTEVYVKQRWQDAVQPNSRVIAV